MCFLKDPNTAEKVISTEYLMRAVLQLMGIYVSTGPLVFQTACTAFHSFAAHDRILEVLLVVLSA